MSGGLRLHRYIDHGFNNNTFKQSLKGYPKVNTIAVGSKKHLRMGALTALLGTLFSFASFSIDMYLTAFPTIAADLRTDLGSVQLTLSVFFIGLALGQLLYGPVIDRYGRRGPLLFGMALYAASSLGLFFVGDIRLFVLLRFLQAVGGCAGMIVGRAVVQDLFDLEGAARLFSMMAVVQAIGPIAAPLLGGYVVTYLGWRSIFGLLCLLGAGSFVAVLAVLPESLPPDRRVPLDFRNVAGAFGALLRNRRFMTPCLAGGVAGAAMFAFIGGSPSVLMTLYGYNETRYGWLFAAIAVGMGLGGQAGKMLLSRLTPHRLLAAGIGVCALFGAVLLALTLAMGLPPFALFFAPLALSLVTCPIITANSAAIAMSESGDNAGCGSSLVGVAAFGIGGLVVTTTGLLDNGTAVPMTGMIFLCGLAAAAIVLGGGLLRHGKG